MRPDHSCSPANLLGEPPLEDRQKLCLGRIVTQRASILEKHRTPTGQAWIQLRHFPLYLAHRRLPAPQQLATDVDELLIPGLEPRSQLGSPKPLRQQMVASTEDLPISAPRGQ